MLQAMRDGMNSWIIKSVLVLLLGGAMGGLVLMDTASFWQSGVSRGSVARVAGEEISFAAFDRQYRMDMRRIDPELAQKADVRAVVARDTLKEQIQKRLLVKATQDSGLVVGDVVAAERVRDYLKPFVEQGALEDVALATVLQRSGLSEQAFVDMLRQELAVEIMMSALVVPVTAPQQAVTDWLQFDLEKRAGDYIRIAADGFTAEAPAEEVLKKFHADSTALWMSPEYRAFSVLVLTPEKVLTEMEGREIITDEGLKEIYQAHLADYSEPDKRRIVQAVFGTEADAKAAYALLKDGKAKTPAEAVEKIASEDAQVIEEEEHTAATVFPAEIADAVFGFEKDTGAVAPVQSPLGWHLVYVTATTRGTVTPFAEVKDALRRDWLLEHGSDPLYTRVGELEDMFAGGASVKEAAEFLNIGFDAVPLLSRSGMEENGKPYQQLPAKHAAAILEKVFTLREDDAIRAEIMETEDGSFIAVSLDTVKPAQKIPYETVAAEVRAAWVKNDKKKQMRDRAEKIADAVRTDGKTLAEAAKEFGYQPAAIALRSRADMHLADDVKTKIPVEAVTKLFALEKTGDAAALQSGDDLVVVTLTERALPDMEKDVIADAAARSAISRAMIERGMRDDIVRQFLTAIDGKYGVKVNEFSFEKQYGKAAQQEALGGY